MGLAHVSILSFFVFCDIVLIPCHIPVWFRYLTPFLYAIVEFCFFYPRHCTSTSYGADPTNHTHTHTKKQVHVYFCMYVPYNFEEVY